MKDETVQDAGSALSNTERVSNWVKDGSAAAAPETVETPAAVAEQPRDPATGKFLAKDAEQGTAESSATPTPAAQASATPTPAAPAVPGPGASAAEVQEFIDAMDGETPFKIPARLRIPLKRGETVEYETIEDIRKRGMLELDYRHKTAELARQRRDDEARRTQFAANEARVKARETWLAEREAEMVEAQKDPEKWDAYLEVQRQYRDNPRFRQVMDDALAKRETDAENSVYREREYAAVVSEGVSAAAQWIEQLAPQFAGVNPERVRVIYAQALTAGQASLDPAEVRAIYEREARYLSESQTPLQTELATLKARLEAMEASTAAEKHNAGTAHALSRAKTPPVAATGRPPAPAGAPATGRFGPNELIERNQAWSSQR